jgi:hep_Hag repeat-containing protein
MTSNVKRHVQLPRSSQKGKKPTADDLKYGEIAVNFNNEDPFLAIKGSDDSIITMGFKDGKTGPWKKGEGEYSAVLDNGTPISPSDKVNTATGKFATAEGKGTTASGDFSHAEGNETKAKGVVSHAEGVDTIASGDTSHAEGTYTRVKGTNSHGEGNYEQSLKLVKNIAIGDTKIFINFQEMSIFVDDDYLKNCYIVNNDKSYKIKGYEESYDFTNSALELTLDKPLEKASTNDNPTEETFISEEYKFINIAVGDVDAGHSEGKYNMVLGESGHAEGSSNIASGESAHAEGKNNIAKGINSHAEGLATAAFGKYAHSEGTGTIASGDTSHAECFNTKALGECSHAEGYYTTASGDYSHAEGKNNMAKGINSHAEGSSNTASGENAHAEGISTIASGDTSHSEGRFTKALGGLSHAEGDYAIAMGDTSHAEGYETNAAGMYSHVEGKGSIALGNATHVEGLHRQAMNFTDDVTIGATEIFILASEDYSVNLDYYKNCLIKGGGVSIDVISAEYAYNTKFTSSNENKRIKLTLKEALPKACTRAEQTADNQKDGYFSTQDYQIHNKGTIENYGGHAEGSYTMVYDDSGHAEGKLSIAKGKMSHAEGYRTIADGSAAHAEGGSTTAEGIQSHAEGYQTIAKGVNSHAEGENTTANGKNSHASGAYTIAENDSEFACGKYNKFNVNQIFSIGVGTADNARKNALYITTDGIIGGDSQLTNGGTSMFGLKINGGIQASEGMISPTYLNSSDERLKKDIETISDNDIDKVKNVNLKSYVFKSDNSKHYGVIAQDVEKAGLSELVTNSSDGMKSVDYISLLILKISELENEIKNLKEQIKK